MLHHFHSIADYFVKISISKCETVNSRSARDCKHQIHARLYTADYTGEATLPDDIVGTAEARRKIKPMMLGDPCRPSVADGTVSCRCILRQLYRQKQRHGGPQKKIARHYSN